MRWRHYIHKMSKTAETSRQPSRLDFAAGAKAGDLSAATDELLKRLRDAAVPLPNTLVEEFRGHLTALVVEGISRDRSV